MVARKTKPGKSTGAAAKKTKPHRWSAEVTETSDAMDVKDRTFKLRSSRAIAQALKTSAEASHRRKASPFRSAMSMLNFYINRAGDNISATEKKRLEGAKTALRSLFGRPPKPAS